MYDGDTFFHLTVAGRIGLAVLSGILGAATIFLCWRMSSRFIWPVKVLFALAFLWLFVWLSPLAYYMYYLLIFEGLPVQVIVSKPPTIADLIAILTFSGKASLSEHSKGVLGCLLLVLAAFRRAPHQGP